MPRTVPTIQPAEFELCLLSAGERLCDVTDAITDGTERINVIVVVYVVYGLVICKVMVRTFFASAIVGQFAVIVWECPAFHIFCCDRSRSVV